jgi:tetratricopeptide (TPR) repeat protein
MSVPPDRVEEITRVVLRVIEEHRPPPQRAGPAARFWGWLRDHPTLPLAFLGFLLVVLMARAFFGVGFWAIASQVAGDYKETQQRQDLIDEHLDLGDRFLGAGELVAAREEFQQALKLEATNVDARRGLLRATVFDPIVKGDYNPAIVEMRLEFLLDLDEDDADAHAFLGDVDAEQFDYDQALAHYETARKKDPDLPHAYAGFAIVYGLRDQSGRAAEMYRRALELAPSAPIYRSNLAYELFRTRRYKAAIREYEHVISQDPVLMPAYNELASTYRAHGDLANARRYQEHLLRLFTDKDALAAERNGGYWSLRTKLPRRKTDEPRDPGAVSLYTFPEKRAYSLLSFALTAYLEGDFAAARRSARLARRIPLNPTQAEGVRSVILFDVALVAKEMDFLARDARRFATAVVGTFGRPASG